MQVRIGDTLYFIYPKIRRESKIFLDAIRFNVDDIRVCKILGSTLENSRIIPGMVFKRYVDSEVKNVTNAKIAVS